MSILDRIGGFLGDALSKLHITVLSGNNTSHSPKIIDSPVTNNHSTNITNNFTLQINGPIDPNQIPLELRSLVEAYKNKQITFVNVEQQRELANLLDFENANPHAKSQLAFFKGKLKQQDLNLLRTGLYLWHLRGSNRSEETNKQWKHIHDNNSKRDRRIINLAGADYFNTYFRPLYKELAKDSLDAVKFQAIFDSIIDDMHFVVFVGSEMGVGQVIGEVVEKARKNLQYGVTDEIIYIHAAGNSVKIVNEAITDLKQSFPKIVIKRTQGKRLLKVSVYYKTNHLEI